MRFFIRAMSLGSVSPSYFAFSAQAPDFLQRLASDVNNRLAARSVLALAVSTLFAELVLLVSATQVDGFSLPERPSLAVVAISVLGALLVHLVLLSLMSVLERVSPVLGAAKTAQQTFPRVILNATFDLYLPQQPETRETCLIGFLFSGQGNSGVAAQFAEILQADTQRRRKLERELVRLYGGNADDSLVSAFLVHIFGLLVGATALASSTPLFNAT